MRHTILAGTQIRTGVVRGMFCYQPFVAGRLGKAVALFPDLGSTEENQEFFEAHFDPLVKNGDIFVVAKELPDDDGLWWATCPDGEEFGYRSPEDRAADARGERPWLAVARRGGNEWAR